MHINTSNTVGFSAELCTAKKFYISKSAVDLDV